MCLDWTVMTCTTNEKHRMYGIQLLDIFYAISYFIILLPNNKSGEIESNLVVIKLKLFLPLLVLLL